MFSAAIMLFNCCAVSLFKGLFSGPIDTTPPTTHPACAPFIAFADIGVAQTRTLTGWFSHPRHSITRLLYFSVAAAGQRLGIRKQVHDDRRGNRPHGPRTAKIGGVEVSSHVLDESGAKRLCTFQSSTIWQRRSN